MGAGVRMSVLGLEACCDTLQMLRSSRFAGEGLKRDLRDEVEFRQARLTAQGKKLRASIDMYGRDAIACVRDGNEQLARQLVSQKVAMQNRLAHISTHWGVLESVRASLQPGARRCLEDVDTCRLIMAKAMSGDVAIRRPGEEDVDGVDEADVEAQMIKTRELAKKEQRSVLCGPAVPSGAEAAEVPSKAPLIDLQPGSDSASERSGSGSGASSDELLCTGDGEGSNRSASPPNSPTRPGTPPNDIFGRKTD